MDLNKILLIYRETRYNYDNGDDSLIAGKKLDIGKDLSKYNKINKFLEPKYVYIPLVSGSDKNITIVAKKGDYVYKGSIVGKSKGNFRIPIHSSVSGIVAGYEEKSYLDGTKVKCIKIENDFKEQSISSKETTRKISKYSKEEFIKILQDCGVIGMGGAGFPTYIKYNTDKKIDTLIVNAVECEPYITADYVLTENKMEELLEAIDAVIEINGIKEGIIAIKKSNNNLIKKFSNYLGTYPKIKVVGVNNIYPAGWERSLITKVKGVDYHSLPLEKGIVVNNISTMYAIYEALKYNRPLVERIVTFTGENLKNPQNVLVKIGTPATDVISYLGGTNNDNYLLIAGGPMMGNDIDDKNLVITPNLNCVLLKEPLDEEIVNCMRCGKCIEVCPAHLSPVLIKDNLNNLNKICKLKAKRCIGCGLCSYVCPSKIKLRELVSEAKKRINSEVK